LLSIVFIGFAGEPIATTFSGTSLDTILPAPITVPLPIVTPGKTITFAPIQTLSPICIGSAYSNPWFLS